MNVVILGGRLGADPELKFGQNGTAILRLRMATESYRKGADGEGHKTTYWHSVTVLGRRAEGLGKILAKGTGLTVHGELQHREYVDRDGNKRWATEILARDVELGARPQGASGRGRDDAEDDGSQSRAGAGHDPSDFDEDDIPF